MSFYYRGVRKSIHSPEQAVLQRLLRETRLQAGLLQEEVGKRLMRPKSYVSRYEVGEKMLDLVELRQILQALDISFLDFMARFDTALKDAGL